MTPHDKMDEPADLPAPIAVTLMASSFMVSQALYVAAKLRLADEVADGPLSAEELAGSVGADASALYRLLRMLAGRGVFHQTSDGRFAQSPLSACLRDEAGSLRAPVILWNEEQYRAWGELLHTIRTGETAFEHMFGSGWFQYYVQGAPETAEIFNSAMTGWTSQIALAVAEAYDFSRYHTLVDVGGGHGILCTSMLTAYPALRGVVFDTEAVVPGAEDRIRAAGLAARCDVVAGDFFDAVPAGGDVYVLSQVLHDWNDERCVAILRNCHAAMSQGGRILIVETVITPGPDGAVATQADLHMLVVTGGRERTEQEFHDLLARAGFELLRIVPTRSPAQIVEAARV